MKRIGARPAAPLLVAAMLLWAGGGKNIDGTTGATRTYPAAGGLYPLELYLAAEHVQGLEKGIYRYLWQTHSLVRSGTGSGMDSLKAATYSSSFQNGYVPACIVMTAVYSQTTAKYGDRGAQRYVCMAVGGAGENVHLQAEALGLGTFIIGAFDDVKVQSVLVMNGTEDVPLYIMPIGKP